VHCRRRRDRAKPLTEFVPLYKSAKDEITTQWAMKEIERVGLLKMDFLGLSTLTLLDDAVKHIKETTGRTWIWPGCRRTMPGRISCFKTARPTACSSSKARACATSCARRSRSASRDLIALNALYRPGPLRGGVVDDYINRKHGRVEIKYELPQMEPVLKETYGVIAYQEQVMRLASDLAGFSLGQADELRRRMGKKDAVKMQAQRDAFMAGCRRIRFPTRRRARSSSSSSSSPGTASTSPTRRLRAARVPDGLPEGELPAPFHGRAAHDRV
jgi:DNA polymerase-3 subunit alpha